MTVLPGGIGYHPNVSETDRVSTYTGLDDYDTLFEVRHGRGALDQAPRISEGLIASSMGITPTTLSAGFMVSLLDKVKPAIDIGHSNQKEHVSMTTDMKTSSSITQFRNNWGRCCHIYQHDRNHIGCIRSTDGYVI